MSMFATYSYRGVEVPKNGRAGDSPVLLVGNFLYSSIGTRGVSEDLAYRLIDMGWRVLTTSAKPSRLPRLIDMLSTVWLKRREYAFAHVDVYSGPAFIWAEAVCQALRQVDKPYLLTLHGGNLPSFARRWPRRVRNLLRSAAGVTTPSRYLLEKMAHYRGDLRLLPNPLDIGLYRFRLRQRAAPRLIWLRAFHEIYNPTMAPTILALLEKEFSDIDLIMVGPDKGDGSLQRMSKVAEELCVTRRITLPGRVPKSAVSEWLNKGDIFINTTNVDNTPVSVMEAMACGLCIVSTNAGGIPYLLEDQHDALLVSPNNPREMAIAISRILTEPGLAEHLSHNARRKAEQFDWSIILPQWEELFASAAVAGRNDHIDRLHPDTRKSVRSAAGCQR